MLPSEAIILAGGFGTRLRDTINDIPKSLAPVNDRPFLSYIIDYLRMQGVQRFIFSLGYKWGEVEAFLHSHYPTLDYTSVIEEEPLGTGGAIHLAMQKTTAENVVVTNGDTLFKINLRELSGFHNSKAAECTIALKPMEDFDRYGAVDINAEGQIVSFKEKQYYKQGYINGGTYIINRSQFLARSFPSKFSIEKDYLEKYSTEGKIYGLPQYEYFIDIGIPVDYNKAREDLKKSTLDLSQIDKTWTLFLDRDGVINDERVGEYVLHWGQFIFSSGVLDSFKKLSDHFGRLFIVSNQRGVGKGLMTQEALDSINLEMQREVNIVGGKIDKIYYCTDTEDHSFFRKPNPGMAYRATSDFPGIDLNKAIMVGNKPSDMKFGRAAGMYTVFLTTTNPHEPFPHPDVDLRFSSLADFADAIGKK